MKNGTNKIRLLLQIMTLVNLLLFATGCVSEEKNTELAAQIKENDVDDGETTTTIEEETTQDGESLKGTCPKGGHCGSPHCPMWSDLNGDSLCDRAA